MFILKKHYQEMDSKFIIRSAQFSSYNRLIMMPFNDGLHYSLLISHLIMFSCNYSFLIASSKNISRNYGLIITSQNNFSRNYSLLIAPPFNFSRFKRLLMDSTKIYPFSSLFTGFLLLIIRTNILSKWYYHNKLH